MLDERRECSEYTHEDHNPAGPVSMRNCGTRLLSETLLLRVVKKADLPFVQVSYGEGL
jgi:hypothetical protein